MWMTGGNMINELNHMLATGLSFDRDMAFDMERLLAHIAAAVGKLHHQRLRHGGAVAA